jgi:hypothetical protein
MVVMRFEIPTQVKFWDEDTNDYIGGIAFEDKIICGCCGGVIDIDDCLEYSDPDVPSDEKIIPLEWVNISEEIKGE